MKIQIEVGLINDHSPIIDWSTKNFFDDFKIEKESMYQFLIDNSETCIIDNVDMFLLYILNNGILAHIVRDNPANKDDEDYQSLPRFNPNNYRIFEINEDGNKRNIQNESGTINHNYFNSLMGSVMDDFYDSLVYLESDNLTKEGRIK